MTAQSNAGAAYVDSEQVFRICGEIMLASGRLLERSLDRQLAGQPPALPSPGELALLARPLEDFIARIARDPLGVLAAQTAWWQDHLRLVQRTAESWLGLPAPPVIEPDPSDRRFSDSAWKSSPLFDFIRQSYLITVKHTESLLPSGKELSATRARQLAFYARLYLDAMAPTNFALSNPTVLRETLGSGGLNLLSGLRNLLRDLERGDGELRITMTDVDQFEVGRNVGVTPGKVVYENDLLQLIQYAPVTETVFRRPLLIIPPWINKYYILDLRPENSFVQWALERGHTVFIVSWVNPDRRLADKTFDDYLLEGSLAAIDAVGQATGEPQVNLVGYCLGGTLLACTLAYLAANGDERAASATFFASLTDFSEPGDLGVFIDEDHLSLLDEQMARDGYLDGASMATAFTALRANDLIWSFYVHNYLLGREPLAFDLLFWNADATRMPYRMHSDYLRQMYLENRLCQPAGMSLAGTPIDLRRVETPTYMVSASEDHIAPWGSTYAATQLYRGPTRFVLSGSGHIAGIVNPPAEGKYGYWTNESLPPEPEAWLEGARAHEGSWWPDWQAWIDRHGGEQVPARVPGDSALSVIEDAPGRYVQVRAGD